MIDANRHLTPTPTPGTQTPGLRPSAAPEKRPEGPKDEYSGAPPAAPQTVPGTPQPVSPLTEPQNSTPSPNTEKARQSAPPVALLAKEGPTPPPPPGGPLFRGDLGPGFPTAPGKSSSFAERLHDFLAKDPTGAYDWTVDKVLKRVSNVTQKGIGVDVSGLLSVERTLFTTLAGGIENYTGGTPPLFMALADGQAAYVNLGPKRADEADHLMRMFAGLPLEILDDLESKDNDLGAVRQILLEKAKAKEFPVYVDTDGVCGTPTPTESIATESIASIARRENSLGSSFPDPRLYYKWLVTRVDSNYRRLDPWMFGVNQVLHDKIGAIKEHLTPPWLKDDNLADPFGSTPSNREIQKAYRGFMEICGNGQAPTWNTLTQIADTTVGLDRDLLSGIQTFWIKLLSEVAPEQRESLMAPISRAWVSLNALAPDSPHFDLVSPANAPYIELLDRHTAKVVKERYDRSLALGQAVDHMIAGLGIAERRKFLDTLMADIKIHQPEFEAREQRLRERLGNQYQGLNVEAIVNGVHDINTPGVKEALQQLVTASQPELPEHIMTPEYADIVRHRDMMDWIATRYSRYGDIAFDQVLDSIRGQDYSQNPLILGEYYEPAPDGAPVSPLPAGPSRQEVLGTALPGREPVKASIVLEGGGGKGFAYVEVLNQIREGLAEGQGQVAIDEFVGNSAGALTAGLLAAGYGGDELADVLKQLDFKKFYSDYMWLSGGVDPKVRGINRTGLFSQQKMYKTLAELIKKKCPVEGRPVLFRDLPFKLKVTSTLMNSDLPKEVLEQFKVQPDGQVVFSNETTPNMDVAAALCCSAAVPGFFNAPQIQVCNDGDTRTLHRMQMVDGGVVNNFPISEVSKDQKSFLLTLPAYAQAPDPNGGPPIALSTLNFDSANIAKIDEYNRECYSKIKPQLMNTIQHAAESGYGRAVIGLNLSDLETQTAPILQGEDRKATEALLSKARSLGLPTMEAQAGAEVVKSNLEGKPHGFWEQHLLNSLLDTDDHFKPKGIFGGTPEFRPGKHEAAGIPELLAEVMGASMVAPTQIEKRLFEKE